MQVQAKTSEDIQLARVTLLSESSQDFQSLWQVGVGWLPPVAAGNNRPKNLMAMLQLNHVHHLQVAAPSSYPACGH